MLSGAVSISSLKPMLRGVVVKFLYLTFFRLQHGDGHRVGVHRCDATPQSVVAILDSRVQAFVSLGLGVALFDFGLA